ncbi:hypothetical protein MTO96_011317 [Rhipicephalus appendiculatus]
MPGVARVGERKRKKKVGRVGPFVGSALVEPPRSWSVLVLRCSKTEIVPAVARASSVVNARSPNGAGPFVRGKCASCRKEPGVHGHPSVRSVVLL